MVVRYLVIPSGSICEVDTRLFPGRAKLLVVSSVPVGSQDGGVDVSKDSVSSKAGAEGLV